GCGYRIWRAVLLDRRDRDPVAHRRRHPVRLRPPSRANGQPRAEPGLLSYSSGTGSSGRPRSASSPDIAETAEELRAALERFPFIDQHCHSLVAAWAELGEVTPEWRRCFTEADREASLERDVPAMRGYREFLASYAGW